MANYSPDVTNGGMAVVQGDTLASAAPFHALHYQFGMLLGVEDFDAAQAYGRGKIRLHNAWLHGEGVVWGFGVSSDLERGEIRVEPGLALDALGHELHLDSSACLNVPAWYLEHRKDEGFESSENEDGRILFDARVEVRFRTCLTRQVPAMVEPCEGGAKGVSYSRAFETVEIRLVPGTTQASPRSNHLLRMLFGLEAALDATKLTDSEKLVQQTLTDVAALPPAEQAAAFLDGFRKVAAWDAILRQPGKSSDNTRTLLFPSEEDAPLLLAAASVVLEPNGSAGFTLLSCDIDPTVRRSHVETATIQELNLLALAARAPADADSARVDRSGIRISDSKIILPLTAPLDPKTVHPGAFRVTALQDKGWISVPVTDVSNADESVSITVKAHMSSKVTHRLIARGTGAEPLLGKDGRPFGGASDDTRRATQHDGIDFVHMWRFVP